MGDTPRKWLPASDKPACHKCPLLTEELSARVLRCVSHPLDRAICVRKSHFSGIYKCVLPAPVLSRPTGQFRCVFFFTPSDCLVFFETRQLEQGLSRSITGPVFSYKLRYIVGFGLVEMAISTNPKPTIYRNLYENTDPGYGQRPRGKKPRDCPLRGCPIAKSHVACAMDMATAGGRFRVTPVPRISHLDLILSIRMKYQNYFYIFRHLSLTAWYWREWNRLPSHVTGAAKPVTWPVEQGKNSHVTCGTGRRGTAKSATERVLVSGYLTQIHGRRSPAAASPYNSMTNLSK